jgi:hypothetical protein
LQPANARPRLTFYEKPMTTEWPEVTGVLFDPDDNNYVSFVGL